ncbi:unnamed protein product [Ceutorhynchus assimilis]|uniref:Uncharacterized protein n=1 Tax=Ceutorhynchus assimilis TaxID=467358 RepID=A0A9N9MSJ3_9CUCU|nr:unnamed protein product [Ceutorhynchus assimilis]
MAEDKIFVSFMYQRCSQNLKLDDSLNSFSEHISADLNLQIHSNISNIDPDFESQATSFDHYIPPCRLSDSRYGISGFMLISDENEVDLLSQQFRAKASLFDHLSNLNACCEYYKELHAEKDELKLAELEKEVQDISDNEMKLLDELEALEKEEFDCLEAITENEDNAKKISQEDRY